MTNQTSGPSGVRGSGTGTTREAGGEGGAELPKRMTRDRAHHEGGFTPRVVSYLFSGNGLPVSLSLCLPPPFFAACFVLRKLICLQLVSEFVLTSRPSCLVQVRVCLIGWAARVVHGFNFLE